MIINKIKSGKGYTVLCKCDYCGAFIYKKGYRTGIYKYHYCNFKHSSLHRKLLNQTKIDIPVAVKPCHKRCMICGKPYDNSFYDKSDYRPLCSKECYSVHFDNWKNDIDNWRKYEADRKINKKYVCVY
jgi:endogenous inhibitor of DNA gyrase (YacG/DUF329 family)